MSGIEQRLRELDIELPDLADVAGEYIHCKRAGDLLYLSGKGPLNAAGKVGAEYTTAQAADLARQVGGYLLAAMRRETGSLESINGIIKVTGYINAVADFVDHPQVIDGCSALFVELFGEHGTHCRTSVGVASLPGNIPVEIDAVVSVSSESDAKNL